MSFARWSSDYRKGFSVILQPKEVEDDFELLEGVSRLEDWPDDVIVPMDPDFPKDLQLGDNLYGIDLAVVSAPLKDDLLSRGCKRVEFLPVKIVNHKGRVENPVFFIMNPLEVVDCIDIEASGVDWNPLDEVDILGCQGLVLRWDAVPADLKIFRPKHWKDLILVHEELVGSLKATGFSGLVFPEAEGYTGVG